LAAEPGVISGGKQSQLEVATESAAMKNAALSLGKMAIEAKAISEEAAKKSNPVDIAKAADQSNKESGNKPGVISPLAEEE